MPHKKQIDALRRIDVARQQLKTALTQDLVTGKKRLMQPAGKEQVHEILDLAEATV